MFWHPITPFLRPCLKYSNIEWFFSVNDSSVITGLVSYVPLNTLSLNCMLMTCSSNICSKWSKSVFLLSRFNCKVVIFCISGVSFPVGQVNTQSLTSVGCHQMKIVITYILHMHTLRLFVQRLKGKNIVTMRCGRRVSLSDDTRKSQMTTVVSEVLAKDCSTVIGQQVRHIYRQIYCWIYCIVYILCLQKTSTSLFLSIWNKHQSILVVFDTQNSE